MCMATGGRESQGMKNDRSSVIWREGQSTVVGSIHMNVEGTESRTSKEGDIVDV